MKLLDGLKALIRAEETRAEPKAEPVVVPGDCERRNIDIKELRAEVTEDKMILDGMVAPYDVETVIAGCFREVYRPGCFQRPIDERQDVVCCWQHDTGKPFARTSSGTLALYDDGGLRIVADVVDAQWARDAIKSIQRGDVTGGSIGFTIPEGGDKWRRDDKSKLPLRELRNLDVFDVSIVTYPQYDGTSISARAKQTLAEFRAEDKESDRNLEMERLAIMAEIELAIVELEGKL